MKVATNAGYDTASEKFDYPLSLTAFARLSSDTAFYPDIEDLEHYGITPFAAKVGHVVHVKTVDSELIAWIAEKARGRVLVLGRYGYTKHAVRIDRYTDGGTIVFQNFDMALYCQLRWG